MKKYIVKLAKEERASLSKLIAQGEASARKLMHARILLKADSSEGVCWLLWSSVQKNSLLSLFGDDHDAFHLPFFRTDVRSSHNRMIGLATRVPAVCKPLREPRQSSSRAGRIRKRIAGWAASSLGAMPCSNLPGRVPIPKPGPRSITSAREPRGRVILSRSEPWPTFGRAFSTPSGKRRSRIGLRPLNKPGRPTLLVSPDQPLSHKDSKGSRPGPVARTR